MHMERFVFPRPGMPCRWICRAVVILLLVCLGSGLPDKPQAKGKGSGTILSLQVNDLGDAADVSPGDGSCLTAGGVCTLRAAMEEVMVTTGSHTITINVTGTIQLTAPLPEITNLDGLYGITELAIIGTSAKNVTVNRSTGGNYRIFSIPGSLIPIQTTISGLTISNGISTVTGGGVYSLYSDLSLNGVVFTGNSSPNGSALYVGGSNLTITNSTFSNGSGTGAAIGYDTLTPTIFTLSNSTISGNSAGGVRLGLGAGANAEVTSSTIASNAGNGIQLGGNGGRTLQLRSNIIAGNSGSSLALSGTNTYGTLGYNLASDGGAGYLTGAGDQVNTDPLLAMLGDYGGTTPTRALLRGSPAIDAGTGAGTPATDQRGVARVGTVDIGAFESRGFQMAIAAGNNQVAVTGGTFSGPLAVTITSGDSGVPVTGAPVTFSPPASGASAVISGNPAVVSGGGAATGSVTANSTEGMYTVTATTTGVVAVGFTLRNNAPPTVVSIVRVGTDPTIATTLGYTVTFNEAVTGLTAANFGLVLTSAPAATITGVSGSGTTWSVSVTTGGGTGRIGLDLVSPGGIADSDGVAPANLPFSGEVWRLAPRVLSISRSGTSPTTAGSVGFSLTFSESVGVIGASAFQLVTSGLSGASITGITGSGTTRTVTVSTGTGSGLVGLNLTDSTGVADSDGAGLGNLPFTGEVYSIAPTVVSIVRVGPSPTGAAVLTFDVTFSAVVSGGNGANFALATSGTVSGAVTGVTGSGATRTVTVGVGSGSGTIGLDLIDSSGLTGTGGIGLANLPFAGQLYTVDRTPPETTITSGPTGVVTVTAATVVFTGSDPAGVASYECRLDAGSYTPCTNPMGFTGLAPGLHSFEVRAVDAFGNIDPTPARLDWTINNLPTISGATIELVAGAGAEIRTIGGVSDPDQAAGTLTVTLTPLDGTGVTLGGIVIDGAGRIEASALAGCGATTSTFRLTVTDLVGGTATATLTVNIRLTATTVVAASHLQRRAVSAICPGLGSGQIRPPWVGLNGQSPGSVLIFNLYTSKVGTDLEDSRIALTNTDQLRRVAVHLFFIDGQSGLTADSLIELTPSQTVSLLASEIDPGTTGYLIAVAINDQGCPIAFNHLVGESLVRFESGHSAALAAQAAAVVDPGAIACQAGRSSVDLRFDGQSCTELPRTLAISSLPARGAGNDTLLIVNRLGGSLVDGAARAGAIAGIIFDDLERGASFTISGGASQVRGMLGANFPRTVPRLESLIPSGRTGWMKFAATADEALSGSIINLGRDRFNHFNQGHNLHQLTTTRSAVLTIPVVSQ